MKFHLLFYLPQVSVENNFEDVCLIQLRPETQATIVLHPYWTPVE